MYLLDTNTVIYFFKDLGQVAERLLSHPPDQIALPAIVVYELETGIAKSTQPEKRRAQLDTLLRTVAIWPFALAEAKRPPPFAPPWKKPANLWGQWTI